MPYYFVGLWNVNGETAKRYTERQARTREEASQVTKQYSAWVCSTFLSRNGPASCVLFVCRFPKRPRQYRKLSESVKDLNVPTYSSVRTNPHAFFKGRHVADISECVNLICLFLNTYGATVATHELQNVFLDFLILAKVLKGILTPAHL